MCGDGDRAYCFHAKSSIPRERPDRVSGVALTDNSGVQAGDDCCALRVDSQASKTGGSGGKSSRAQVGGGLEGCCAGWGAGNER